MTHHILRRSIALFCAILPALAEAAEDPRLPLLSAMQAELDRSIKQLRIKGHEPPYFLSYQVLDDDQRFLTGRYGAVFSHDSHRSRRLYVDVRVGSYEMDNSGGDAMEIDFANPDPTYSPRREGPLDDDVQALRNSLWLLTDDRYKNALSLYLKRRGKRVFEVDDPDRVPSFSHEKPVRFVEPPRAFPWDEQRWAALTREVSALFKDAPEIFDSEVRVEAGKEARYFASSEGSALVTEETLYAFHVSALTRADDGQLLENSRDFYGAREGDLPDKAKVVESVKTMIGELSALRKAPVIDPYTGPALLAPEATGVLFHEAVGHRLEGDRQDDDKEGRTFKGQVGKAVLPEFLSIADDPTLERFKGTALNGYYRFDDEGVAAQRVSLIERGVLRGYLLSRKPIKGFANSNGHGRSQGTRQAAGRMANLVVESAVSLPYPKLKEMLLEEARRQKKPYGLLIKDITGGNTNTSSYGYQAFKGQPRMVYRVDARTGKEELVRGVEMVGTPLTTINKIAAMGDEPRVFNGFCGAESGYVPVSTVAPAAFIREIELQRNTRANERAPVLPSPWSGAVPPKVEKPQ